MLYTQLWRNDLALTTEETVNFLSRRSVPLAPVSVQWLTGARRDWKRKDPIGSGAAWGSRQPQPLAPQSQEKFQLWPYMARTRNSLLRPDWSRCQALSAPRALQILAWGLLEERDGHQEHSVIAAYLKDFKQCTFTKIFSLFKFAFACQLLNCTQPSRGKSRLSCSPFMGEGYR